MERDEETSKSKQETGAPSVPADGKVWEEPKLTRHGDLEKVTGKRNSFFGEFSP